MKEVVEYSDKERIEFKNVFLATGSAGTQAGLITGKALTKWNGTINGIAITKNARQIFNEVKILADETGKMFDVLINDSDILVDDNYIGESYGAETESAKEAISLFAKQEGILLDNVYTGKAAAGMIDYIRKGKLNSLDNLLFIHTGGNIQLFK
jgi:1-aminocyclopropane-1-carboxylate deaminase/D-cysteine desulfhydrase-like pyridoxal-dependent ACC family enzyme